VNKNLAYFRDVASGWLCGGSTISVAYCAHVPTGGESENCQLWSANVRVGGAISSTSNNFEICADDWVFGFREYRADRAEDIESFIIEASAGRLTVGDRSYSLAAAPQVELSPTASAYSELLSARDAWFSPLQFRVRAGFSSPLTVKHLHTIDTKLRRAKPPFDGLADIAHWLGLNIATPEVEPTISIAIFPPVQLDVEASELTENKLHIVIKAHPGLHTGEIELAIRGVPDNGVQNRFHASGTLEWEDAPSARTGKLTVDLGETQSALVMLMVAGHTAQRQWFLDKTKAANLRFVSMSTFDKDLRKLSSALLEGDQSRGFEQAVANLLFLHGFTPTAPNETEAPDLIVLSPAGRLIIVECTLKTTDIASKLGKLVDRRECLRSLTGSNSPLADPVAVLVCRAPRESIVQAETARKHNVILATRETLVEALQMAQFNNKHPDEVITNALAALQEPADLTKGVAPNNKSL